jgi:hypothetical protein
LTAKVIINGKTYVEANLNCPMCASPMRLRWSEKHQRVFYGCSAWIRTKCKGSASAHQNGQPMGEPGTQEVKDARVIAHESFDRLWEQGYMDRDEAYAWMRGVLKLPSKDAAHIGLFDVKQCTLLLEAVERYLRQAKEQS